MRSLYLVRHAIAQERDGWSRPDWLRPLNEMGWRQAAVLADLLADAGISAHYSSPAIRCHDTLLPLAHGQALSVEDDSRLLEGGPVMDRTSAEGELSGLFRVYFGRGARRVAVCCHGDFIPPVLEAAGAAPGSRCPKGGVWRLDLPDDKDRVTQAVYLGRADPGGGWDQR
ncbi:MAG: phosphoglycerate mutase family protein [Candidatus Dormibacteria bacterium]